MPGIYNVYGLYEPYEKGAKEFLIGVYQALSEDDAMSKAQIELTCNGSYDMIVTAAKKVEDQNGK